MADLLADRNDTASTDHGALTDQLRRHGVLGPFRIEDWAVRSDIGSIRSQNDDRWAGDPQVGFVVADGMGGLPHGGVAAEAASQSLTSALSHIGEATAPDVLRNANDAVAAAGRAVGTERLGTTVAALVVRSNHVVALNVGDSRIYRCRRGTLELLTHDHSVRNEMLAAGISLDDEGFRSVRLDALTAYVGQRSDWPLVHHAASFSVMADDRFVVCTDGVHGQLDDATMMRALDAASCAEAAGQMIDAARTAGGRDNATVIIVEFKAESES